MKSWKIAKISKARAAALKKPSGRNEIAHKNWNIMKAAPQTMRFFFGDFEKPSMKKAKNSPMTKTRDKNARSILTNEKPSVLKKKTKMNRRSRPLNAKPGDFRLTKIRFLIPKRMKNMKPKNKLKIADHSPDKLTAEKETTRKAMKEKMNWPEFSGGAK